MERKCECAPAIAWEGSGARWRRHLSLADPSGGVERLEDNREVNGTSSRIGHHTAVSEQAQHSPLPTKHRSEKARSSKRMTEAHDDLAIVCARAVINLMSKVHYEPYDPEP